MASTVLFLCIFLLLLCRSTFTLSTSHSINPVNDGFVLSLIQRDSPRSPFYNHSMTPYDRRLTAAHRFLLRLNHLHQLATSQNGSPDFSPKLIPDNSEYVINFYIGTQQPNYTNSLCSSDNCTALASWKTCTSSRQPCTYAVVYADKSRTEGIFSSDKFIFEAPDESLVDVGFVQFGYSIVSSSHYKGKQNGCVGLSPGELSLISQLGIKKFSHCKTIPDDQAPRSLMYFGSRAVVYGSQTPILQNPNRLYYVSLEGISVGNQRVPIPPGTFNLTPSGDGGFIVDSGTAYTVLKSEGYQPFLDTMRRFVQKILPGIRRIFELCFDGTFHDVEAVPEVTFHFAGGADVKLIKESTFVEYIKGVWCVAILRSSGNLSILGNMQMRNFWVGYDLERGLVSFQPTDCATF
ncbi:hypothetical protein L6164_025491 [Bauhinia variegata]|uniref:Uncharacterized protein n=1 Tax=Bauhinia variegata TaxID=167791 RepID=A0ACB9M233_BAUVA|nr:hypothetical protein L6164_025491 [Bauhinia variegata]